MRTHDNLLSDIASGGEIVLSKAEELTIIVLSLNHLFGRYGFLKSAVTGRTTAMIEATESNRNISGPKSDGTAVERDFGSRTQS